VPDTRGGIVVRDRRGERRDPTAGTTQLGWTAPGSPMIPEWDSAAAIRSAYYAHVFVYRCVQVRARALAALPFRVGADPAKPKDFDRNAPLAKLLGPPPGGPNQTTTARRLWAWTIAQRIVTGRNAWEIEANDPRRPSRPTALWPLPSSSLKAFPTASGAKYFERFEFGPAGRKKNLTADQVVYAWNPSAEDWREPESALQAARLDISIAVMQNRYDYAFLKNDARPAAVVVTKEFEDDDAYDRFKGEMLSEHRGPDNAGKLAFLEDTSGSDSVLGMIDIKQLGLSQTDAQFIAREESKIRAICVALGVPMSKLGDASKRTFNNAGQETLNFETDTVLPDAHDFEDDINLLLAPLMGDGLTGWFDLSSLSASQSRKFAPVALPDAYKLGIVSKDEARAEIGFEPEDEVEVDDTADQAEDAGVTLLERAQAFAALASTLTPESAALLTGFDVTAIEAKPTPTPTAAPVAPVVVPAQGTLGRRVSEGDFGPGLLPTFTKHTPTGDGDYCATCGVAKTHHTVQRTATSDDRAAVAEARRAAMWKDVDARATAHEHIWARQMRGMFDKQEASTVSRLLGKRGRQLVRDLLLQGETRAAGDLPDAGDLFDPTHWAADMTDRVTPLYEGTVAQGAHAVASKFGVAFDLSSDLPQLFIKARANKLSGQVTDTTYRQIQQALADGVDQGLSIDELAQAVRDVFSAASSQRAEVIARTEVLSSYNGGQDLQAQLLPSDVAAGREWISTRDERVRDAHAEADGQTVAMGDAFNVDGEDLQYPGDPEGSPENVIQCRCTFGVLTPDEMPTADDPPARARQLVEYRVATTLLRELVAA
jgi:HK97 family phage portal protein